MRLLCGLARLLHLIQSQVAHISRSLLLNFEFLNATQLSLPLCWRGFFAFQMLTAVRQKMNGFKLGCAACLWKYSIHSLCKGAELQESYIPRIFVLMNGREHCVKLHIRNDKLSNFGTAFDDCLPRV